MPMCVSEYRGENTNSIVNKPLAFYVSLVDSAAM